MKHKSLLIVMALVMCVALAGTVVAQGNKPEAVEAAITTKFTHQGQIKRNGVLYNGTCNMRFTLWDAGTAGAQLATYTPPTQIPVSDGVFTVEVDFGASFTGQTRWLQAEAKCADDADYTNLPRVALNAVPYAMSLVPGAVISTTGALGLTVRAPNGNPLVAYGGANGYAAIYGSDTSATGGFGVYGISNKGTGLWGTSTAGAGVVGKSTSWIGVYGESASQTAIWGKSTSAVGVYGTSSTYAGVWGESDSDEGVRGVSHNASHGGVVGINDAVGGIAVYGIAPNGGYAAWFNGRTKTNVVELTGGADLAERFSVSEDKADPGTLLIIDAAKPGHLTISTRAYDTKVAGIVSGAGGVNPGLTLHQAGVMEGDTEVAIAGRVYVKATSINGAIEPGDLLTTSDRPGYAMKASDPDRSHGAVIGKAMTALDHGEGLVLVLVNLQ
jgi:hypothetical protein